MLVTSEQIGRFLLEVVHCLLSTFIMTHMSSCYTLQDSAMHFHAHLEEGCACLYIFRGEIVEEVEEGSQEKWWRLSGSSKQTIKPGAVFSVAQKPGTVLLTYVISLHLSGHTREGVIFFFLSPYSTRPSRWTLVKRVSECFGLICSTDQIVLLTEPVFSCLFRFFFVWVSSCQNVPAI